MGVHEMAQRAWDGAFVGATGLARAGAQRYGHGLTKRRTMEKTDRRTRLRRYISGKKLELMSQKCQESSSSRDGDVITSRLLPQVRLGWLAPSVLRLALRYIYVQSRSLYQEHSLPTVFGSSCAVPPQKSIGLFSVRVGCSVAQKFKMDTNGLEWNGRPRVVLFHSNRSNPVEIS